MGPPRLHQQTNHTTNNTTNLIFIYKYSIYRLVQLSTLSWVQKSTKCNKQKSRSHYHCTPPLNNSKDHSVEEQFRQEESTSSPYTLFISDCKVLKQMLQHQNSPELLPKWTPNWAKLPTRQTKNQDFEGLSDGTASSSSTNKPHNQ